MEFVNEMESHQRKIDVQTQSSPQIQQSWGNLEENGETWRKMFINAVVCIFEYSVFRSKKSYSTAFSIIIP